jgi:hypothetical protein
MHCGLAPTSPRNHIGHIILFVHDVAAVPVVSSVNAQFPASWRNVTSKRLIIHGAGYHWSLVLWCHGFMLATTITSLAHLWDVSERGIELSLVGVVLGSASYKNTT